jgi:hypothetical protein
MTDTTTISIPLDELSLDELVQVSQGIGREIDKLREQRAYLKAKIDARLARDAIAPGAVIEAKATT